MTNRNWMLAGTAIALIATAGLGFGLGRMTDKAPVAAEEHAEEDGRHEEGFVALSPADAAKAGVLTTTIGRGGGAELVLPGRVALAANASAALGAPVSGTVERVHVAAGDRVAAGAAIVTLRSAEGAGARASVDAAAAGARAAQAAAARDRRLFEAGVVARQDWEASQANADKAQAELRAARAQVAAQGGPSAGGVATLRAPIAGIVTRIDARVGGFLTQGGLVAEIANQSAVEYVFDAPPASAGAIKVGDDVLVQRPEGGEAGARIVAVAPSALGAGAAVVRAKPTAPAPQIGSIVSARVILAKGAGGLTVPADAVQTLEGRTVVFVAGPRGFRATPVVTGRTAAGSVEILKGLTGGETIAGKGAFRLKAELGKGEAGHED
ncbi:efflux RND transporter periplasmic adaptor subunit [Caulobacter segnis]|uniref:Efflux transporter, RND family, MFP subunit n=2 Tax=Caulobacter segnis TaxID=88688 RepID=D5VKE4_CAUST|nr:efflux RND transporter periplasmic adaptor subunit [Caulobacter segnis]ADG10967.1 efflux transporter, RND family, MFP subunit [Caulobacter segnis ATCC 21756]AVQ02660.1 efflux RND transporter periplasmic adaptor subunit [Caulobacter segnis]